MIAIAVFINLIFHISCQQMQSWPSFSKPLQASVFQQPYVEPQISPGLSNLASFQAYQQYTPQSTYSVSQFNPRTTTANVSPSLSQTNSPFTFGDPSSSLKQVSGYQMPFTSNLSQKVSQMLSRIPKTKPSTPVVTPESATYTSLPTYQFSSASQIPQTYTHSNTFSPPTSSLPTSLRSAAQIQTPSPIVSPSSKAPRSIIPSPLTETIPLFPHNPFKSTYELPEPSFGSVGCLDLTMTPYGTISETTLPDLTISLPRSPYLPVSSPVSAFAPPLSPLLPPASPAASSSNFLRKVPIPPPFI